MDEGIISARYAKALLRYATERGDMEKVYEGICTLGESFSQVPSLRMALDNPVIDSDRKLNLLMTASGNPDSESIRQFYQLVIKNNRIGMVQFMAYSYMSLYRQQNHLIHSRLTIPVELDDTIIRRLEKLVKEKTKNEVEFVVDVDPSIIGGFVMEYDTYSMDASVRSRLKSIRKKLLSDDRFLASNQ